MVNERDDDALSWAGEESDPTLVTSAGSTTRKTGRTRTDAGALDLDGVDPSVPDELRAAGDESDDELDDPDDDSDAAIASQAASSALLITLGIAAGVYLLYTIGWVITLGRQLPFTLQRFTDQGTGTTDYVGLWMYDLGLILAVAAPALWFAGTLLLARKARPRTRVLLLVLGALLLAPLPFVGGN